MQHEANSQDLLVPESFFTYRSNLLPERALEFETTLGWNYSIVYSVSEMREVIREFIQGFAHEINQSLDSIKEKIMVIMLLRMDKIIVQATVPEGTLDFSMLAGLAFKSLLFAEKRENIEKFLSKIFYDFFEFASNIKGEGELRNLASFQ